MNAKGLQKMQECVDSLGVSLLVNWQPGLGRGLHGEIRGNVLFIYDVEEGEAWRTLMHELTEFKLDGVTRPYRLLVNGLIEVVEKTVYAQKEEFIDFLPKLVKQVELSQNKKNK
ncbi:MAG: hypothetical protein LBH79_02660 [Nitrososphaerota archaeon]|jgi:hypothetical protein|nr:hypothetical protein [Nitrososphaerota archaeon]